MRYFPTSVRWIVAAIIVLTTSFFFWHHTLTANWSHAGSACFAPAEPVRFDQLRIADWNFGLCERRLNGADPQEYWAYFFNYPTEPVALKEAMMSRQVFESKLATEFQKRPLFGLVSALLVVVEHQLAGLEFPATLYLTLSLYAAACTTLVLLLAGTAGLPLPWAVLLALFSAVAYSWLSIFSIPESYSLSVLATLATLLSGLRLQARANHTAQLPTRLLFVHLLVVLLASWIYLPCFGGLAFIAGKRFAVFDRNLKLAALVPPMAVVVLSPQWLMMGGPALQGQIAYGTQWGGFANFLDPAVWLNVVSAFTIYSIVPSSSSFLLSDGVVRVADILAHGRIWIGSVLALAVLFGLGFLMIGKRNRDTYPLLAWFAGLVLFHVYFNPAEALLYNSVPFALLLVLIALKTAPWIKTLRHPARAFLACAGLVATIGWVSTASVFG